MQKPVTHRPERRNFLPAAVDGVYAWLGLGGVEKQLVVVAAAFAAGLCDVQRQAAVAAELHGGGVPAEGFAGGVAGGGGAAGYGEGEAEQGGGFDRDHDVEVRSVTVFVAGNCNSVGAGEGGWPSRFRTILKMLMHKRHARIAVRAYRWS